jgi:uncharacterized zinc-type alcohol dehydrogenase-like protein
MKIECYATMSARGRLEKFEYTARELGEWDIEVAIGHCGICYSDVHLIDNDWGMSSYPLVPGHEIVGHVRAMGSRVTDVTRGQRVGIGWQCGACLSCESCIRGEEHLCPDNKATCAGNYGGFAKAIVVDSRFAFPVPEKLASENVGPLLCGGITVYSPLRLHNVRPSMKVGVIGIGGLGHLALQFARAFGCEVTAFSSSPGKEEEARRFGAHHFIASNDPAQLQEAARSLDFVISTIHGDLDWNSYLALLRPNGRLHFVGVPQSALAIAPFPLLVGQLSISGSVIGSRAAMREMLDFAARHDIRAQSEVMPMSEVNTAITRLRENRARYRLVLKN